LLARSAAVVVVVGAILVGFLGWLVVMGVGGWDNVREIERRREWVTAKEEWVAAQDPLGQ